MTSASALVALSISASNWLFTSPQLIKLSSTAFASTNNLLSAEVLHRAGPILMISPPFSPCQVEKLRLLFHFTSETDSTLEEILHLHIKFATIKKRKKRETLGHNDA